MRTIVVPGEEVSDSVKGNVYTENEKTFSLIVGLFDSDDNRIIPLNGIYMPERGDQIVGIITEVKYGSYVVDINSAYISLLLSRREYNIGDTITAEVKDVNEVNSSILSFERQLTGGEVIDIPAVKVPRIIGKKNSMINMLIEKTKTSIVVGKNGRIWMKGKNTTEVKEIIDQIQKEAHLPGLTDKIKERLEGEKNE